MSRFVVWALALIAASASAADSPNPTAILIEDVASPAAAHSLGPALTTDPNGTLWLSWVEPGRNGMNTLRCSTFDAAAKKWRGAHTIASSRTITTNPADFPHMAVDGVGHAVAIWTDGRGGALYCDSTDGGARWTPPSPWSGDNNEIEQFSLVTLADGRVLAAWLDGRARKKGGKVRQLYARIIGTDGPDMLVDPMVCDCCPTALTAFPDGTALVAYRGRTEEETRDIRIARFRGQRWDEPRPLNSDDWRINSCPANGPRLASDGGRIAAAWLTKADDDPRVLATYSPDAGARFIIPLRLDKGMPIGNVDTLLLHDTSMLVTWLEQGGGLWLRRINPEFTPGDAVPLALGGRSKFRGLPRVALVRDYAGGNSPAQLLVAGTTDELTSGVRTALVTIPEGALLEAEKNCDCAPTPEQLQGYPIRGVITDSLPPPGLLRVKNFEVPGIFPEGTRDFKVAPDVLAAMQPGRQFLGRIERRNGVWWLFDVRLMAAPKP